MFKYDPNKMFKYGDPYELKSLQPSNRNAFYTSALENSVKNFIDNSVSITIKDEVNNYFSENITNIFNNETFIENITNEIINNDTIINNITNILEIPPDIEINSIALLSEDLDRIAILDTTHFYNQLIIGDEGSFTTLTSFADYGIITDKNIYVDGKITIKDYDLDVINGELYFNGERVKDIDNDEIYNNITSWNIDENENSYTFSNIAINTSDTSTYELNVNGDTNISGDIILQDNTITVIDNDLYFNNRLVTCCEYGGIQFYFQVDYDLVDLVQLETDLIAALQVLGIDTTYMTFTFISSCIKVNVNIRDDILLNPLYIDSIIGEINNIKNYVENGQVIVNINGEDIVAIPNIYLLNSYYYFNKLSPTNAFKLVKRNDESNVKGVRDGYEVYLMNISNEYLQKDFTFSTNTDNRILLKVHAYKNSFLTDNDDHCISLSDEFKLEILLGIYAEEICHQIWQVWQVIVIIIQL